MQIQITPTGDQLLLQLGPCQANLTQEQAGLLRARLAEILLHSMQLPRSHWEIRQNRVRNLDWLAEVLEWLNKDILADLLVDYDPAHRVALFKYARKQHPKLAARLMQLLPRRTAEQLEDELAMSGAIPVQQVALALEALHPLLAAQLGTKLAALPDANLDPEQTRQALLQHHELLQALPSLPEANSQRTLQQLQSHEQLILLWLANHQGWQPLEHWLLARLPGEAEQLTTQMQNLPPQPAWVLLALAQRIKTLTDLRQPQPPTEPAASPALDEKARNFLQSFSELPAPLLQLVLKRLARDNLAQLITACQQLKALRLYQRLEKILPERFFHQMQKQHPAALQPAELRSLMTQMSQELKRLKSLQQEGETQGRMTQP
ncbi:hypothetical protein [Marinospirillum alkaliphilum]|uniref:F-box domain-containing protein n=1 Tax=Marinospirillum alkaliphilum DSM 21637 TaxID=1122209 RepID=A0A1K1V668_9GAMM|nr:hypothetical protein [Marinospirillum alkaliphilum]SFX20219.1 hypothetical protein SAMN02745752_00784 [Marinospirillum alkaliphilum DSM 21637]